MSDFPQQMLKQGQTYLKPLFAQASEKKPTGDRNQNRKPTNGQPQGSTVGQNPRPRSGSMTSNPDTRNRANTAKPTTVNMGPVKGQKHPQQLFKTPNLSRPTNDLQASRANPPKPAPPKPAPPKPATPKPAPSARPENLKNKIFTSMNTDNTPKYNSKFPEPNPLADQNQITGPCNPKNLDHHLKTHHFSEPQPQPRPTEDPKNLKEKKFRELKFGDNINELQKQNQRSHLIKKAGLGAGNNLHSTRLSTNRNMSSTGNNSFGQECNVSGENPRNDSNLASMITNDYF